MFRGLAAANKALGGDAEKLKGIMLATTQVFSKGKVAAEELRGQIGERLPGAFSKFAEATGRSTQELDKALELGEVGLEDFVLFAQQMLKDYEEDAKKIASGPEEAGARLQTALSDLQRNVGPLLTPIGAAFQTEFTAIINIINRATQALANFLGLGTQGAIKKTQRELNAAFDQYNKLIAIERRNRQNGLPVDLTYIDAAADKIAKLQQELRDLKAYSQPEGPDTPDPLELKTEIKDSGKEAVDNLAERIRLSEQAVALANAQYRATAAVGEIEKLRAQAAVDLLRLDHERINALAKETDETVRRNIEDAYNVRTLERQLELSQDIADIKNKPGKLKDPIELGPLQTYMNDLRTELGDTESMIVSMAQTIEQEIGSAMSSAILGLIDGTKTAQEAFADMFKNIGEAFISMATEMIAKALVMKALGIITGGGQIGSGTGAPVPGQVSPQGLPYYGPAFSGGGYTGDGPRVGGLDGQGGFPAILHPQETVVDHRAAMGRYGGGGGAGGAGGAVNVNYSGPTLTFNSEDYLPVSAVPEIINAAAKKGATAGHTRTMSALQNNRSSRARLGMR